MSMYPFSITPSQKFLMTKWLSKIEKLHLIFNNHSRDQWALNVCLEQGFPAWDTFKVSNRKVKLNRILFFPHIIHIPVNIILKNHYLHRSQNVIVLLNVLVCSILRKPVLEFDVVRFYILYTAEFFHLTFLDFLFWATWRCTDGNLRVFCLSAKKSISSCGLVPLPPPFASSSCRIGVKCDYMSCILNAM